MKNFPRNQVTHYDTFDAFMEGIEKEFGDSPAISWFLRNKTEMCRSFRETAEDVRQLKEALYIFCQYLSELSICRRFPMISVSCCISRLQIPF